MYSISWVRIPSTLSTVGSWNRFLLGIFENLIGFKADLSPHLVSNTDILKWLLARIQSKTYDGNRGYAAELISILLQNNRANRLAFGKEDGVEICLKVLSVCSTDLSSTYVLWRLTPVKYSNIGNETQEIRKKQSSWRTFSTHYARHSASQKSRSCSSTVRASI